MQLPLLSVLVVMVLLHQLQAQALLVVAAVAVVMTLALRQLPQDLLAQAAVVQEQQVQHKAAHSMGQMAQQTQAVAVVQAIFAFRQLCLLEQVAAVDRVLLFFATLNF
jgi:hypothetical protein